MPTVPRRDPTSTPDLNPLPGAKFNAAPTEETFGGGASATKLAAAQKELGDITGKIFAGMKNSADKAKAQASAFNMDSEMSKIQVDSKRKKGESAFNIIEENDQQFNSIWQKYSEGLSEAQKRIAYPLYAKKAAAYRGESRTYVGSQIDAYEKNVYDSGIAAGIDNIGKFYYDPGVMEDNFTQIISSGIQRGESDADIAGNIRKAFKSGINGWIEKDPNIALEILNATPESISKIKNPKMQELYSMYQGKLPAEDVIALKSRANSQINTAKTIEENEREKAMQLGNITTGNEFIEGKLQLNMLDVRVDQGLMTAQAAAAWELGLQNAKSEKWLAFSKDDTNLASKGKFYVDMLDRHKQNPESVGDIVLMALNAYNNKEIGGNDLVWVIHKSNDYMKNPNSKENVWWKDMIGLSALNGSAGVGTFMHGLINNSNKSDQNWKKGAIVNLQGTMWEVDEVDPVTNKPIFKIPKG